MMPKYYECHVTIEPVFDEKLLKLTEISRKFGFRVADLFLQKRKIDIPERSRFDSFCTAQSNDYDELYFRMKDFTETISDSGFALYRMKIEGVLYDNRMVEKNESQINK